MKKIILGLSVLCSITFTSCKEDAAKNINDSNISAAAKRDANSSKFPVIEFEEAVHDFGEIEKGKSVKTVFVYKNVGDAPLVITDIGTTCGCTVPKDWSREALEPGGSGKFTVNYNGSGNGNVKKQLTLTANTEKGKEIVEIKAFVKPDPNAPKPAAKPLNAGPLAKQK